RDEANFPSLKRLQNRFYKEDTSPLGLAWSNILSPPHPARRLAMSIVQLPRNCLKVNLPTTAGAIAPRHHPRRGICTRIPRSQRHRMTQFARRQTRMAADPSAEIVRLAKPASHRDVRDPLL